MASVDIMRLWVWACSGNNKKLENYYENGGELNRRYPAFEKYHSLIAGALRNKQYSTVEYLISVGETTEPNEFGELFDYYKIKLLNAAENLTDYYRYHNKNLTNKQYELFEELEEIVKIFKT